MHCNRYRISGQVQGVFYRASTQQEAVRLGLVGWVRNCRDGSVEVVAEGDIEVLKKLVQALQKGSRSSAVKEVKTDLQDPSGEYESFYVRGTF